MYFSLKWLMIANAGVSSENILCNPETVQCHTIKTSNSGPKADQTSGWGRHRALYPPLWWIMPWQDLFVKECWQRQMESPENTFFQISAWLTLMAWHIFWNTCCMQETPRYILVFLKQKNTLTKQNYACNPTSQFRNLKEYTEVGRETSF